jgi:DNA-binding protein HU-beta
LKCLTLAHGSSFICWVLCPQTVGGRVNKGELVDRVRAVSDLSRSQAEVVVDEVLTSVMDAVRSGERVSLSGFGSFNQTSRAARTGRNPQTGEPVKIPASRSVRFAPATAFKSALNTKRAGRKAVAAKKAAGRAPARASAAGKRAAKAAPARKAAKTRKR